MSNIVCGQCGIEFPDKGWRPKAKFCSRACAAKARSPLGEVVCVGCGVRFQDKKWHPKCCSPACANESKRRHGVDTCVGCGKLYVKTRPDQKYCRMQCYYDICARYAKCEKCGKQFRMRSTGANRFCSRICANSSRTDPAVVDCILRARLSGKSRKVIARQFGIKPEIVRNICRFRTSKKYTPEFVAKLIEARRNGMRIREVAEQFGVSERAVLVLASPHSV